jgi:thiol-disulfide isomerase/thioredoxin
MPLLIIGKVYANWCGYCRELKPEWAKLKKMAKAKFVEFEASQTKKKSQFEHARDIKIEAAGYPTIFKITPDNQVHYYNGPRTAHDIHSWTGSPAVTSTRRRRDVYKSRKTRNHRRRYPHA